MILFSEMMPFVVEALQGMTRWDSARVVVLEASVSARGGLEAVIFSWLGLASASHGLASVLARSGR